jgi:phage gpG-like protein
MLGIRSGQLRQSVRWTPSVIEGDTVTGSIGSQVRYAAVHEFGFDGDVQVKPFFRKNRHRDQFSRVERVSTATGRKYKTVAKTASGLSQVKGHKRHMRIPARAPFGYGVQDNVEMISRTVSEEVTATLRNL